MRARPAGPPRRWPAPVVEPVPACARLHADSPAAWPLEPSAQSASARPRSDGDGSRISLLSVDAAPSAVETCPADDVLSVHPASRLHAHAPDRAMPRNPRPEPRPVSYTHLTLPTIYS